MCNYLIVHYYRGGQTPAREAYMCNPVALQFNVVSGPRRLSVTEGQMI